MSCLFFQCCLLQRLLMIIKVILLREDYYVDIKFQYRQNIQLEREKEREPASYIKMTYRRCWGWFCSMIPLSLCILLQISRVSPILKRIFNCLKYVIIFCGHFLLCPLHHYIFNISLNSLHLLSKNKRVQPLQYSFFSMHRS